jgi:hypothetical protein
MLAQESLQRLALELKAPRENTADQHWDTHECRHNKIVIRHSGEGGPPRDSSEKIKSNRHQEQSDREMDQHNMLCMLSQQRGFYIEGIQIGNPFYLTTTSPVILG